MFTRRKLILLSFVFTSGLILFFPLFNCNQQSKVASYHKFAASSEFQKLSRHEQILKCASCHKKEYENEKDGPHSNAYKILMEHKDYVNDPHYESRVYKDRVNSKIESCSGCHSTHNLLETSLKDYSNMDTLTAHIMHHPNPDTRMDMASRITGLDCFTCHYDGNDFISLKSFNQPLLAKELSQSLSTVAKNNMSCYPCHFDVLDSFDAGIAVRKTGSMLCINCHVETDHQGQKTHYFYWKRDPEAKKNPLLTSVLNDFRFNWTAGKKEVQITWENKSMPHTLPIATELLFKFEVLGSDSNLIARKMIRVNRKKQYDKDSYEDLGNNYLAGTVGEDFPLYNVSQYLIPIKASSSAKFVRISYTDKSQFWLHDSIGRTLRIKVVNLPD